MTKSLCSRQSRNAKTDSLAGLREYWDDLAPKYDRKIRLFERLFFPGDRLWACSLATGDTLEVAIGTGRNLAFYPPDVRVTGVDLSPGMLEIARRRARTLGRSVDLQIGNSQALAFPDESFDTALCTLSLCCVPDVLKAVTEMARVLRPGGQLILVDHVRSDRRLIHALQRVIEPLWIRLHSDSLLRRPLDHIAPQGLTIEHSERRKLGIVERVVARKSTRPRSRQSG